jgi:hypothetical protein
MRAFPVSLVVGLALCCLACTPRTHGSRSDGHYTSLASAFRDTAPDRFAGTRLTPEAARYVARRAGLSWETEWLGYNKAYPQILGCVSPTRNFCILLYANYYSCLSGSGEYCLVDVGGRVRWRAPFAAGAPPAVSDSGVSALFALEGSSPTRLLTIGLFDASGILLDARRLPVYSHCSGEKCRYPVVAGFPAGRDLLVLATDSAPDTVAVLQHDVHACRYWNARMLAIDRHGNVHVDRPLPRFIPQFLMPGPDATYCLCGVWGFDCHPGDTLRFGSYVLDDDGVTVDSTITGISVVPEMR